MPEPQPSIEVRERKRAHVSFGLPDALAEGPGGRLPLVSALPISEGRIDSATLQGTVQAWPEASREALRLSLKQLDDPLEPLFAFVRGNGNHQCNERSNDDDYPIEPVHLPSPTV